MNESRREAEFRWLDENERSGRPWRKAPRSRHGPFYRKEGTRILFDLLRSRETPWPSNSSLLLQSPH